MKQTTRVIPLLFHLYFLENFNLTKFLENHEPVIREHSIRTFVFNSPYTILYSSVISMLKCNPYTTHLGIDHTFPSDLLVDIFRPFLYYYYISNYFIRNTIKIHNATTILYMKLYKFYEYNKLFGRKIIKIVNINNKIKKKYIFNTNHISFNSININNSIVNLQQFEEEFDDETYVYYDATDSIS